MYMQMEALFGHAGNATDLFRHLFRYLHHALYIVVVLAEATHLLDMLGVVGIVIVGIHRTDGVETLHEHSLTVGIGKAHRTHHLGHSPLAPPVLYSMNQRLAHLKIIDEIEPSEPHDLLLPALVSLAVDDGSDAPHHLTILPSQEIPRLAVFKRGIPIMPQRVHLVKMQIRHIIRVVFVQVVPELYEGLKIFPRLYALDFHRWFRADNPYAVVDSFLI